MKHSASALNWNKHHEERRQQRSKRKGTLTFAAFLLFSLPCIVAERAQASGAASLTPRAEPPDSAQPNNNGNAKCLSGERRDHDKITVAGCLVGESDHFTFTAYSGRQYQLVGKDARVKKLGESPLAQPLGQNVCVQGALLSPHSAAIRVIGISILPDPQETLDSSIIAPSRWTKHIYQKYGLNIALPRSFERSAQLDASMDSGANLPIENSTLTLDQFEIPDRTFLIDQNSTCGGRSHFYGGGFTIFVNTRISSRLVCNQFGDTFGEISSKDRSSHKFHGIDYLEGTVSDGWMGHECSYYFYHTLQNGLCYAFGFASCHSNATSEPEDNCSCAIASVPDAEYERLARAILSRISFSKPEVARARSNNSTKSQK